ncbi:MAG: exodeoxyribonuclease VII small subunit [Coriobacteriales bacterium]|jgi:exodeoxyribonuclease VII small subunit|nr:exodeoxyribonuclease VII small subunit [Coriobacteriales bacterium]
MDNQGSYMRVRERLEEIVVQVRSKDIPLEKSLDLYEEALRLGGICAEMIDRTDFSTEELASLQGDITTEATAETDRVDVNETQSADTDERADDAGSVHTNGS